MNKKFIGLLLVPFLLSFASCSSSADKRMKVICSIYPEYEWVENIIDGVEDINLSLLVDSNIDFHSFEPSIKDIANISDADVLIYVGGESEKWISDITINNPNQVRISLFDILGEDKKIEENKEGMQVDEEEEEYDEHVFNSLINAQKFVTSIATSLGEKDSKNKAKYLENASIYNKTLNDLHLEYVSKFTTSTHLTQVVADRFPFRYLFDDYGLDYYAAFKGCSSDSEASFATIIYLANKVDELNLDYILKTSNSDGRVASAVKDNTINKNQTILSLDSLETKSSKDKNYLSIMKDNLDILLECTK